jgi:hypothetical protein
MTGVVAVVVGFGGAVLGANEVMTRLTGVGRNVRQWLAIALFLAVIGAVAWALRRLQDRGLV